MKNWVVLFARTGSEEKLVQTPKEELDAEGYLVVLRNCWLAIKSTLFLRLVCDYTNKSKTLPDIYPLSRRKKCRTGVGVLFIRCEIVGARREVAVMLEEVKENLFVTSAIPKTIILSNS